MGRGIGQPFDAPVPFFLIKHSLGNVLFDTGNALSVVNNKAKHWGTVVESYDPVMTKDDYVVAQLIESGVKPEEITHVIFFSLAFGSRRRHG